MEVVLSRVAQAIPFRSAVRLTSDERSVLELFWRICVGAFGVAPGGAVTPAMRKAARELLAHYGSADRARRALRNNPRRVRDAFRAQVDRCRRLREELREREREMHRRIA